MSMRTIGFLASCTVLGLSAAVCSASAAEEAAAAAAAEPSATSHQAGLRVYVDPETGALVSQPVTAEQRAFAASSSQHFTQDDSKATAAVAADGSRMWILNGEFEMALNAAVDADGTLRSFCDDASHAAQGAHVHLEAPVRREAR
jgi:hypothetical protein